MIKKLRRSYTEHAFKRFGLELSRVPARVQNCIMFSPEIYMAMIREYIVEEFLRELAEEECEWQQ